MLTLSIPGDDVAALLMGAFLIHGLTPGPMIFFEHPDTIYAIFAGFLITDLFLLGIAKAGFKSFVKIASLRRYYIFPCVTVFAFAGAFTAGQNMDDILVLIVFTVLGYSMRLVGLNPAVFIIGFILTPFLEQNLDKRYRLSVLTTIFSLLHLFHGCLSHCRYSLFIPASACERKRQIMPQMK